MIIEYLKVLILEILERIVVNYSIPEIIHIKKYSNVNIVVKNKNIKKIRREKLRKKYESSELKLKKICYKFI